MPTGEHTADLQHRFNITFLLCAITQCAQRMKIMFTSSALAETCLPSPKNHQGLPDNNNLMSWQIRLRDYSRTSIHQARQFEYTRLPFSRPLHSATSPKAGYDAPSETPTSKIPQNTQASPKHADSAKSMYQSRLCNSSGDLPGCAHIFRTMLAAVARMGRALRTR